MERNMKILFTVTNDLNHDQRMIRICSALQEAGHDCTLIGRKLRNSAPPAERPFGRYRLSPWFEKGKLFYIEFNIRLFFFLLFSRFDVIWAVDCDTALPARLVSMIRRKPWVFDAHELFTHVPEVQRRPGVQRVWEVVQRMAFRRSRLRITVGSELAAWFSHRYGVEVEVIRNAPESAAAWPYEPDSDPFILYQGALNEGRGLENLLQAMPRIPCRLVLAGEGDLSHELRKLSGELGLNDKVQFLGRVLPEELPALTARARIGYNVSENAGLSYYLSLNNKFFDYVHAGLPSLINPFPEYMTLSREIEVGIITEPDVDDIVEKALLLLNDEALHERLHRNCIKAREIWNWEHEKARLIRIFEDAFHG